MDFSIVPHNGDSTFKLWPPLAARAFCLKSASRPDETIFYYDSAPPCSAVKSVFVLIHGLGDEADSWRSLIPLLNAVGYRVLAPDLPGFGRSVAAGKISLKNHAAAVLKLIETAVPGETVFLAGNSMGAMVAEAAAMKRPELAAGLVLLDGSIPGGPANPGIFALAKLLFSRKWYRSYRDNPETLWASLYPYYADLDAMPPEDRGFLKSRVMARVESRSQERAFFVTQRSLVWTFLTASSCFARKMQSYKGKILLIWGAQDRIMPLSSAKAFAALRADIKLEIIHGAGHLPHQEKPDETARLMADFANVIQAVD